jgi:hypothetical protein
MPAIFRRPGIQTYRGHTVVVRKIGTPQIGRFTHGLLEASRASGARAVRGIAVAEQAVQRTVNWAGIEPVVADKGYQRNEVMRKLAEWKPRGSVAEAERGAGKWKRQSRRNKRRCLRIDGGFREREEAFAGRPRGTGGAEVCVSVRHQRHRSSVLKARSLILEAESL